MRLAPLLAAALLSTSALASDLDFGFLGPDGSSGPVFLVTPDAPVEEIWVVLESNGVKQEFHRTSVRPGSKLQFEWTASRGASSFQAWVTCNFVDGSSREVKVPFEIKSGPPLSVDLSHASADVARRVLTVDVTSYVDSAEIIAYGAHKTLLENTTAAIGAGPGKIEVPWVGAPGDVVLLEVKLISGTSWASFDYSPWFLDIPHEDVLFETAKSVIRPEEEHKLQETMRQLHDVLDKYGAVVPVKLYIAGCTDTVGGSLYNEGLSRDRARAIAAWLRRHGYTRPIFYYGFGEGLPAVSTGDNVDEQRNRRALYMVGSNPPPAGSGIPQVRWIAL